MEELLITEPGPPKGAKPINGTASKSIAPPVGAKKKEDTVSEPDSNDGSTQAGSDVSQEPGPKGAQPSGKSTEDKHWFVKLGETLAAPVESFVRGSIAAFTDMLPGMVAAGEAGMAKNDYENVIVNQAYPSTSTPMGPVKTYIDDNMRKAAIDNYVSKVGSEQFTIEKDAYELNQLRRRADLLKYSDQQDKERKETMGDTPQTTGEIKDIKTALQWLGGAGGNAIGTAPAMLAGPVFPFLMEKGEAYKEGLGKIQEETGLSRDEILALDLDKAARENSDISGALNTGLELAGNLAVFGRFIPKNLASKFISKIVSSKVGAPAVAAMGEGSTEFVQAIDTKLAAYMSTGKYADVFEAANAITPEEWEQIREEGYTGAAGGTVISGGGELIQGQQRASKLADIKNERAIRTTPAPAQVVSETRTEVKSTDDTQGAENAAEKILEVTQDNAIQNEKSTQTEITDSSNSGLVPADTGGNRVDVKSSEIEAPVQEEQGVAQGIEIEGSQPNLTNDISTVGTNYQKVNGNWQVKQADGSWADIATDTPNKTPEQQSTELTQMKDLLSQMEASEPQNLKMSPTEKGRIAKLEPQTERGAVRKFFWDGGKVLWRTQDPKSSIPRKGIAEEGGLSEGDKAPIKEYVDDKKGLSIDQIAEKIADQYPTLNESDVKTAVIEVLAQSDPETWYAEQMETEDQEYLLGKPARDEEMSNLSGKIARLEAEEQGINETNKQLYENERRVNRGGESQSGSETDGQVRGEQKEEEGGGEPTLLIQQNGNRDKSQQALEELKTLNLTHVPGLGMGQNQAKGTYISTEDQNRYETADKKAIPVTVAITNPYVADESYFNIERAAIQKRFGKKKIEDLDFAELDLLSTMMTEYFSKENYDSIYFPKTETQEGELIVFNRNQVNPKDTAQENAIYESMQTPATLEFIDDKAFLETEKPMEYREKQKKIRKEISMLNKLIKCK